VTSSICALRRWTSASTSPAARPRGRQQLHQPPEEAGGEMAAGMAHREVGELFRAELVEGIVAEHVFTLRCGLRDRISERLRE
jgi:hypothetical protein